MLDSPRLLIVEDQAAQRERLCRFLAKPYDPNWTRDAGIAGFEVTSVGTAREAIACLEEAERSSVPFEALLLDLSLPATPEDAARGLEDQEHGRELLTTIHNKYRTSVIVLTAYETTENLVHCLREGAVDFIAKPLVDREAERILFTRLVGAVCKTREAILSEIRGRRQGRLENVEFRKRRDHVAAQINLVAEDVRQVLKSLSSRYGIDPARDPRDPLFRQLLGLQARVETLASSNLGVASDLPQDEADVAEELDKIIRYYAPLYRHRFAQVRWNQPAEPMQTRVFREDLLSLLDEIAAGCLEHLQTHASRYTVEFSCIVSENASCPDIVVSARCTLTGQPSHDDEERVSCWRSQTTNVLDLIAVNIGASVHYEKDEMKLTIHIPVI